ncbi:MAG: hypothetical protein ACRDT4_09260 [Micromonosporaceae bacterium]
MSTDSVVIPALLRGLVDDAAVFPPGNAELTDAVSAHRTHRAAWYADLVGPLLVRASEAADVPPDVEVGLIGDTGLAGLDTALAAPAPVRQIELAVAKRGEDPLPGLRELLGWAKDRPFEVYAEIPLTWGCLAALDELAGADGVSPKFRTGGLAAELFPTAQELATVIVACAEHDLRFKLTAGLHHAVRHTDRTTGFTHHGFLNVLVASAVAAHGGDLSTVAALLAETDPDSIAAHARPRLDLVRPLWIGFGSCSISEPLDDLAALGLLSKER